VSRHGVGSGKDFGRLKFLLVLPALLWLYSCSDKALSLFFDIPASADRGPATTQQQAVTGSGGAEGTSAALDLAEAEGERPEIENVLDWDKAVAMLPKDAFGDVDWTAARRDGVIKPRGLAAGPGESGPVVFKWDFFLTGPAPTFDAFFPHSEHTEWLSCENCHPAIFPLRKNEISMTAMYGGEYCGTCHGTVAFKLEACARCHTKMQ